jgi:GNAT superfamily N-acetyltransferase
VARAAALTEPHSTADRFPTLLIGVVVLSYPSALHRTRHRVFGLRSMPFGERLHWVNANLRTISRVVVHPQFRGVGLSTTLIRAAVDACPTPFVEASARMGRAHPLFDRAGFTRVEPITPEEAIYFWLQRDPSPSSPSGMNTGSPPDSSAGCVSHNPDEKKSPPWHDARKGQGG